MTHHANPKLRIRGINRTAIYAILAAVVASTFSLPLFFDFSDSSTLPVFFAIYSALLATVVCVLIEGLMYIPFFGTNLALKNGNRSLQIGYWTYQFDEIDQLRISTTKWHSVDFEITSNGNRRKIHLELPESQSALESFQKILIALNDRLRNNFEASGSIVRQIDA